MKKLVAIASSCALFLFAYLAIGLDDWLGASRNGLFESAFVLLGIIFGTLALTVGRHKGFLVVPSIYVLFILALPFLELSPVKPAVRAVHEIQPGMSEAQVRAILDRHFPEQGHFKRPAIGSLTNDAISFVLDRSDGRYNAAIVSIKFSKGKCVSAEFLAD
jgi:hypothetical protein